MQRNIKIYSLDLIETVHRECLQFKFVRNGVNLVLKKIHGIIVLWYKATLKNVPLNLKKGVGSGKLCDKKAKNRITSKLIEILRMHSGKRQ